MHLHRPAGTADQQRSSRQHKSALPVDANGQTWARFLLDYFDCAVHRSKRC